MVSPDFISSNYCYNLELTRALQRHEAGEARVIPVILRPCHWHDLPFGKLLATPRDGKAITKWPNIDEAFFDIVQSIKDALREMGGQTRPAAQPPSAFPRASAGAGIRSSNLGVTKQFTDRDLDSFRHEGFESPYCIWCLRNVANIRALTAQVSGRYNIIGISILGSGTEQFISEHGVRFPVYIDAGGAASATWGAFGTPTTIVVSPNGKILDLWSGAYRDSSLSEIQSALHVKLPGLQDVPEHARVTQPDLEATEYLPSNELSLRPTFMANIDQRKLVRVPAMADIWYEAQTDRVRYLRALQPSRLQPSHNGRCIRDSSNNVIPITKLFAGEKLCFVTERLHSVELTVKQIPGDRTSEPLILALPRETEHH